MVSLTAVLVLVEAGVLAQAVASRRLAKMMSDFFIGIRFDNVGLFFLMEAMDEDCFDDSSKDEVEQDEDTEIEPVQRWKLYEAQG